jgi:hypothetical protein
VVYLFFFTQEKKIQIVKDMIAAEEPVNDVETALFELLDQLIADCT